MSSKAVNAIYQLLKDRLKVTPEQFAEAMQDWEFVELKEGDDVIGAVMVKENELHIGYSKKPKFTIRKHLRDTLRKTIDIYGSARTSVMKSNEKGINFCKRLGFEIEKEDQDRLYLKCDRCNYV